MKFGLKVLSVFLATLSLCSVAHATWTSWSYENHKAFANGFHIGSVCMMPVEGQLTKVGMKGGEGMSNASDTWSTTLQTLVEKHLTNDGVQLMPASNALSSGASEDELRQILLQVQQKYNTIAAQLNRKPKAIAKERYTLGDDVALLPCSAKSDVLVFVQGEGDVLTGGRQAMGWVVGGQARSYATLVLTFADAKSGEIVAFARLINYGDFMKNPEKAFGEPLDIQLKKLKIGNAATQTAASQN